MSPSLQPSGLGRRLRHLARRAVSRDFLHWLLNALRIGRDAVRAALRNRSWTGSVRGTAPVVVSLASHDERIRTVHLAIEAIASGTVRPRRLILWVPDADVVADPPEPLARLVGRGLELRHTEDLGPHAKYYPYVCSVEHHELPLVTADDDVLYDESWLEELLAVHERHPRDVVAHRAHRIRLEDGRILPYALWESSAPDVVSHRTFATGLSGVLYPPHLLDALREAGTGFTACCPQADDVWLHATALRHGVVVRPVTDGATTYPSVPGTLFGGLWTQNVLRGGNDAQIAATYTPADVAALWRDQLATEGPVRIVGRQRLNGRQRRSRLARPPAARRT